MIYINIGFHWLVNQLISLKCMLMLLSKKIKKNLLFVMKTRFLLLLAHCHHQGHLYLTTDTKFVSVISVLSPGSWSKIGVLARPFFHKMFNFQFIFFNKKRSGMLNDCDLALWYCFARPDSKKFSLIINWDLRCSGSMEVGLYSTSRHLSNKIVCTCNKTILIW